MSNTPADGTHDGDGNASAGGRDDAAARAIAYATATDAAARRLLASAPAGSMVADASKPLPPMWKPAAGAAVWTAAVAAAFATDGRVGVWVALLFIAPSMIPAARVAVVRDRRRALVSLTVAALAEGVPGDVIGEVAAAVGGDTATFRRALDHLRSVARDDAAVAAGDTSWMSTAALGFATAAFLNSN